MTLLPGTSERVFAFWINFGINCLKLPVKIKIIKSVQVELYVSVGLCVCTSTFIHKYYVVSFMNYDRLILNNIMLFHNYYFNIYIHVLDDNFFFFNSEIVPL